MAQHTTQRTSRISVRLNDDMNNRLNSISASIGVPSSTLAALAIGQYVADYEHANLQKFSQTDSLDQQAIKAAI